MDEVLQHDEARAWRGGEKGVHGFSEGETNDGFIEHYPVVLKC